NHYKLDAATTQRLREGDIVALDDQYTFIQRIPRSHYVLAVGPGINAIFPAIARSVGRIAVKLILIPVRYAEFLTTQREAIAGHPT
ncbi:hypothetical protein MJL33_28420, partial [Salmonella enterica subsp. enterica serovar Kentucky]|nr:hypothetical protein [Salmonella enterica subsp. enterica serovar Kentucky]